jgi:predicted aspartyl protease
MIVALVVACSAGAPLCQTASRKQPSPDLSSATVPLIVQDNRVFIELNFRRANGTIRKARAWVDTGGGWFAITEDLARDIGSYHGEQIKSDVEGAVPIPAPRVLLGAMPLDLSAVNPYAVLKVKTIDPGINAEAFLPARVLMHYDAVFDYPHHLFTLAKPGVLKPRGIRISTPVQPETGFVRTELDIDGQPCGFLLDTGAAYTMISQEYLAKWHSQHAQWSSLRGAVGEANMVGKDDVNALLLRIPVVRWGSIEIKDVGAVSRRVGTFETSMSRWVTAPIIGAVAGNVLKTFRVEIDYPNGVTYLEQAGQPSANDLDSLGIIFDVQDGGSYSVAGIAEKNGTKVLSGVQPGDRLVSIDNLTLAGATRAAVINSMQGKVGDKHKLRLARNGKEFDVELTVQHLL